VNYANSFVESLSTRPVGGPVPVDELRAAFDAPLPEEGIDPSSVVVDLAKAAEPGIVGTTSGRYFGFVIGGVTPAALAADWLTSVWDQNAGLYAAGPAASVVEEVAGRWLKELLGIPAKSSFGFVTGAQMANFTGLAAARHHVLDQVGWDVEADGLQGAPTITVVAGEQRHGTLDRAVRYLGLGPRKMELVPSDDQGRMRAELLDDVLPAVAGPTIVCAQAGNVNSGAFDPLGPICDIAHSHGAWVHVDGAFGQWAAVSPRLQPLLAGHERADSWATDGHKWLNVPYDSGIVFCAHPTSHVGATSFTGAYLQKGEHGERDESDWNPESSRRARAFAVYASIREHGRKGIVNLIERCCDNALRFAEILEASPVAKVLNEVVLNQVLVRFYDDDELTHRIIEGVQRDGTCWLGGTTWQGQAAMRISVSNWSTNENDVDRSADAILRVAAEVKASSSD
jgi:glutamate/tyrosine decarboxylase-like PLP-dependent enzyme